MPAPAPEKPNRPTPPRRPGRSLGDRIGDWIGGWLPEPAPSPQPARVRVDDGPTRPLPGPRES